MSGNSGKRQLKNQTCFKSLGNTIGNFFTSPSYILYLDLIKTYRNNELTLSMSPRKQKIVLPLPIPYLRFLSLMHNCRHTCLSIFSSSLPTFPFVNQIYIHPIYKFLPNFYFPFLSILLYVQI